MDEAMRCDDAMQIALDLGDHHDGGEARARDAALTHLRACPSCLARLDQLARAALSGAEDEISCAECRDRMPDLRSLPGFAVDAVTDVEPEADLADASRSEPARLARALRHLRRCPDCAAELPALDAVLRIWEAGRLPELERRPAFDLSFLDSEPARLWQAIPSDALPSDTLPSQPARRLRRLLDDLVVAIEDGAARFGRLPAGLQARPVAAGAFRESAARPAEQLLIEDAEAGLRLRMVVGPTSGSGAVVGLTLLRGEGDRPLSGARVILQGEGGELLASDVTAEDGGLQFRGLAAGSYQIEIRQPDWTWQLPLRVEEPRA